MLLGPTSRGPTPYVVVAAPLGTGFVNARPGTQNTTYNECGKNIGTTAHNTSDIGIIPVPYHLENFERAR
jgi:hypothetical protein